MRLKGSPTCCHEQHEFRQPQHHYTWSNHRMYYDVLANTSWHQSLRGRVFHCIYFRGIDSGTDGKEIIPSTHRPVIPCPFLQREMIPWSPAKAKSVALQHVQLLTGTTNHIHTCVNVVAGTVLKNRCFPQSRQISGIQFRTGTSTSREY